MSSGRIDGKIARVATKNDGVFDRRQAHECRFSDEQIRYRLSTGVWGRDPPGRIPEHRNAGDGGGNASRSRFYGPATVRRSRITARACSGVSRESSETKPELVVPMRRHPRSRLVIVHRSDTLIPHDFTRRAGLRCTTASRTIIDLAACDRRRGTRGRDRERETDAARDGASRCRKRLDPIAGRGRAGATELRRLLDVLEGAAPSESRLEVKVARLLRLSPLPAPVRQHRVRSQGRRYRLDFAWPELRLALECDGRAFHEFQTRSHTLAAPRRLGVARPSGHVE